MKKRILGKKDISKISEHNWKERNPEYIKCLQKFLDRVDNVEDEQLKMDIIGQMLKCDNILTRLAEKEFERLKIKKYKFNI